MLSIYRRLERNFSIPLFLSVFLIDLIYHLFISWIITLYDPEILEVFEESTSLTEIFLLSVVFGPLIETFLFQYLIIEILYGLKRLKINTIILISALTFSSIHYYNFLYVLVTFLSGIIYASYYLYIKEEKKKHPFLTIWMLHLLYNFSVFILDDVLKLF